MPWASADANHYHDLSSVNTRLCTLNFPKLREHDGSNLGLEDFSPVKIGFLFEVSPGVNKLARVPVPKLGF